MLALLYSHKPYSYLLAAESRQLFGRKGPSGLGVWPQAIPFLGHLTWITALSGPREGSLKLAPKAGQLEEPHTLDKPPVLEKP